MGVCDLLTLSLLVCVCVVITSALPRHVSYSSEAYIDCNDLNLARRMEDASIPFSCMRGTGEQFVLTVKEEAVPEQTKEQEISLGGDGGEITLILDESIPPGGASEGGGNVMNIREEYDIRRCQDPLRCGNNNFQRTSPQTQFETVYIEPVVPKCPHGFTFVSEIGECLSVGVSSPSVSQREQYFVPNSETLTIRECKEGYYFDLDKGKCLRNKKFISANQKHFIHENALRPCQIGYTFVPEVGICLPIPHDVVSRPQNIEPATISLKFSDTNCPSGSVYNPEVDLCLMVTQPKPIHEKPQAMAQVTQSEQPAVTVEKTKCKPGTVYNSEIDLCSPIDVEVPQGDESAPLVSNTESVIKTSKTTPDPFRPVLLPLTAESIGASKCKQNEVYVSEIDLCLEV